MFSVNQLSMLRTFWLRESVKPSLNFCRLFCPNCASFREISNLASVQYISPLFFRPLHSSVQRKKWEKGQTLEKQVMIRDDYFKTGDARTKSTFLLVVEHFIKHNTFRREHIEFIYTSLKHLEEYGVQADIEVYKTLMSVFPEGRFVPETNWQVMFEHYPKHQRCALDLLETMEKHGVCPDLEMRQIIVDRFGAMGKVFKKYARMMYWFPKFKNLSPFPLPDVLPNDSFELAKLAVARMMIDLKSVLTVYHAENLLDSLDKTWIVSGQSPLQQKLISKQKDNVPFYVQGPFFIWLKQFSITYFMLSAENTRAPVNEEDEDPDDISNLEPVMLNPSKVKSLMDTASMHEQEDGIVLGLCATGTSSRDSLLSWIRFLQESNPRLKTNPVLFTLKAPSKDLVTVNNQEHTVNNQERTVNNQEHTANNQEHTVNNKEHTVNS